jgi:hypothetical protein
LKKLLIIGIPAVQRAELYLHAHESLEDAQADRESCEDDGAYAYIRALISKPLDYAFLARTRQIQLASKLNGHESRRWAARNR